jgi:hypothetical protein
MSRPFLIQSPDDRAAQAESFVTGAVVPETGMYRVVHAAHRLPHEMVLMKGERFPRCCKCSGAVLFDLVHAAPDLYRHFVHKIYELPVIEGPPEAIRS